MKKILLLICILTFPLSAWAEVNSAEMVAAHNRWRAQVGVPDIAYSEKLAASAQEWADHLKDSNACNMAHSGGNIGENIYLARAWSGRPHDVSPRDVVDAWAGREKNNYHYESNSCSPGAVCGHYTQVVWKNTTSVGCAKSLCNSNDQMWVCQYSPPGNYVGQKPY